MLLVAAHHNVVVFITEQYVMEERKWHNSWLALSILLRGAMLWRHLAGGNCSTQWKIINTSVIVTTSIDTPTATTPIISIHSPSRRLHYLTVFTFLPAKSPLCVPDANNAESDTNKIHVIWKYRRQFIVELHQGVVSTSRCMGVAIYYREVLQGSVLRPFVVPIRSLSY